MYEIAEWVGLAGVAIVLVAYFMIATRRWRAQQLIYPITNIIGTLAILFSVFYHFNWPSLFIQLAWIVISLIGIMRILRLRKTNKASTV